MLKRRNQDKSKLVYKLMPETIQQQQQRMIINANKSAKSLAESLN